MRVAMEVLVEEVRTTGGVVASDEGTKSSSEDPTTSSFSTPRASVTDAEA